MGASTPARHLAVSGRKGASIYPLAVTPDLDRRRICGTEFILSGTERTPSCKVSSAKNDFY